jgi:hypothetical protein
MECGSFAAAFAYTPVFIGSAKANDLGVFAKPSFSTPRASPSQ